MKTSVLALSATAALIATLLAVPPARAQHAPEYAWCAVSSSKGLGQPLCHFVTLEQCTAFLQGLTGSCRPNPRAPAPAQPARRVAR